MVDSIKGPGKKIIITTKPKPKAKTEGKETKFDRALKNKSASIVDKSSIEKTSATMKVQDNMRLIQQQQLARMQHIENIASQIRAGTYKMASPEAVAEKIYQVLTDSKLKEKFLKKLIQDEKESAQKLDRKDLTELELKKLVFLIKEAVDINFDDPELAEFIELFS